MAQTFGHCNTDQLQEAFGRALTKDEMVNLSNTIEENARFFQNIDETLTRQEALTRAVPQALKDMQNTIARRKREVAQNMAVIVGGVRNLEKVWKDMPAEGVRAMTIGSPFLRPGAKNSAASAQVVGASRNNALFRKELGLIDKDGTLLRKLNSGEIDDALERAAKAIDDVDGAKDTIGDIDPDAVKLAKIMIKHSEMARQSVNLAGGNVKRLPGRLVRRSHNSRRMRHAMRSLKREGVTFEGTTDQDAWVNYMEANLDLGRVAGIAEDEGDSIRVLLSEAYDSLSRGEHLQAQISQGAGARATFGIEQERLFHFKNGAEGEIEYRKIFGNESVRDSFFSEMDMMGHKEGLLKTLGPDPSTNLQAITLAAQKLSRKAGDRAETQFNSLTGNGGFIKTKGQGLDKLSRYWKEISGQNANPVENIWTTMGAGLRFSQNISKLGRATLASVVDVATIGAQARYLGRGFFDSYSEAFGSLFSDKSIHREVWESLQIGTDVMNGHNTGRWSVEDAPVGMIGRANTAYFRFNLLSQWTDNLKRGAAISNARYLGTQSTKSWDKLDSQFSRLLETYGFDAEDWATLSKINYADSPDGKKYMSMDALQTIDDASYAAKAKTTGRSVEDLKRELDTKLRNYFNDQVDSAVITPDAQTRATTTFGLAKGTIPREIAQFFFQFKAFPLTMYNRVVRREMFGRGTSEMSMAGVLKNSYKGDGNGEARGMAELMMSSTVMGYVALTLKDLSQGLSPRKPEDAQQSFELMLASMLQGGAAGIYGDILLGDAVQEDPLKRGVLETLGGPVISFVTKDIIGGGSALTYGMMQGEDGDKIASRIWGSTQRNLPLANTFWLKAGLDRLMLNRIQEDLSPGSMDRLNKRAEERGQEYLIPLGAGGN